MPSKSQEDMGLYPLYGEPRFTLLARDPQFATLIEAWVASREAAIRCGERPASDIDQVNNAKVILAEGAAWRLKNNGVWRNGNLKGQTETVHYADGSSATGPASLPRQSPEEQDAALFKAQGAVAKVTLPSPTAVVRARAAIEPNIVLPPVPVSVYNAIKEASLTVRPLGFGNDLFFTLLAFAKIESDFNPTASARAGTAAGLYQFTHETWTEMVNGYGGKYKITADMVYDPLANATMAAERMISYGSYLKLHFLPDDAGNMYCLHFLGMAGGTKLITCALGKSLAYEPNTPAATAFPIAAQANPGIFGHFTLLQLYKNLHFEAQSLADAYAAHPFNVQGTVMIA